MSKIQIPDDYKPSEKEKYMCENHLAYFRKKLENWKGELLSESHETIEHLKTENWQEPDINDRASVEMETTIELRTRDRYRKLLDRIDSAIRKIDEGEYGYCEETGEEIGLARLEARPNATLTIEAQERHERHERTHSDDD